MMAQIEGLSREDRAVRARHRRTLAYVATFGLWQIGQLLAGTMTGAPRVVLAVLSLTAAVAWMVLLVLQLRENHAAKNDPPLLATMQDERARDIQLRAYRAGFWATLASVAILGVAGAAMALSAYAISVVVIVVGVGSFLVACVVLDRE